MTGGRVIRESAPSLSDLGTRNSAPQPRQCSGNPALRSPSNITSMRPRNAARVGEVVRISHDAPLRRIGIEHPIRDAIVLAIGDGFVLGIKPQPHLLPGVRRTGPPHERL